MKNPQDTELIHAVLDGEASPEQVRELDRLLVADPAARAEYEELRQLFDQLSRLPESFPPEGLVDSVLAQTQLRPSRRSRVSQLFGLSRVSRREFEQPGARTPGSILGHHRASRMGQLLEEVTMNQPKSGSIGKRKVWIGTGIAAVAVAVVGIYAWDTTSTSEGMSGTIVPAQRYRSSQPAAADVGLGNQSGSQSTPAGAAVSGSATAAGNAAGNAAGQAAGNAAAQAAGNAAGQAAGNAAGQAAGNAAGQAAGISRSGSR